VKKKGEGGLYSTLRLSRVALKVSAMGKACIVFWLSNAWEKQSVRLPYALSDVSWFPLIFFFLKKKKTNLKANRESSLFSFSLSSFLLSPHSSHAALSLPSPLSLSPPPITTTFSTERHHRRRHPPSSTSGRLPTTPTIQEPAGRTPPTAPDHCRHHQSLMPTTIQCLRSPPTVPAPTISPPPIFPKFFPRSFL
jgi:hypothetical protein